MDFDRENWKDIDINVDSLWIIGPRAKGGKHSNSYHGNFVPQIPNQMIRRFTKENDVVLDMFCGSGTTLFECELLRRNFIGFDINQSVIDQVMSKMEDCEENKFFIHNCAVQNDCLVKECIESDMSLLKKRKVNLVLSHPPYWDIIKFTDKLDDLSNIPDLKGFISTYINAVKNVWDYLCSKGHFVLIIGDVWKDGEVKPLGFLLMNAIKQHFKCKLKGVVIKDIVGNRAKLGQESLWRYRALKSDNFLFKHEYVFVFRKEA